ncbi:MAG: hypothetical protein HC827_13945 [Cyanobacteria bacterium RM1_2_2]|nr:hypothetical protein [Cyanobacteria bacterium RM1_2_2]
MQVIPLANQDNFGSEWVLDNSWIAPPVSNTLAELIQDLTQGLGEPLRELEIASEMNAADVDAAEINSAEPEITLDNLFEVDFTDAETPETPGLEPDLAINFLDLPKVLDLESKIPPIQQIEIQQIDSDSAASLNLTLANLFEADPAIASDSELDREPEAKELVIKLEPEDLEAPAAKFTSDLTDKSQSDLAELDFVGSDFAELNLAEPDLSEPDFSEQPEPELNLPEQTEPDEPLATITSVTATVDAATETLTAPGLDPDMLDQLDQLLAEPAELTESVLPLAALPPADTVPTETQPASWFLGIDIGTTGISAVLLNQSQCQLYPLYWQAADTATAENHAETSASTQKQFRLSTTVTLAAANPTASALPTIRLEPAPADAVRLHLSNWKPYLKLAVPHYSPQTSQWEPVFQWSDAQSVPLRTLQEALQQLLATLHPNRLSFMPALTCAALGLEADLQAVLRNLTGIVVGYPSNWSDTYSFNVREAILQAELIARPDQIVFLEESIAALLSALPATDGRSVSLSHQQVHGHLHNADWRGITLILSAGASLTELVLVNLPQSLAQLNPTDFYVRSLPYAGQSLDQDVLSQLLYPVLLNLDPTAPPAATRLDSDFEIEPFDLTELGLANLSLPAAAELDFSKRYCFQQVLFSSSTGQQLLTAARSLKVMLQYQPRFTVQFGSQQFTIERQDLTSRVILPYLQRLNRELNTLLAQTNTTAAAVSQVICTGGTASLGAIARWLQQKLPNATIIQDTYPQPDSQHDSGAQTNRIPSCSRVAYGLAVAPLHPQVIDRSRHQYSDYFLLLELLRTLPAQPVPIETIMQLLEQRGIDTQTCRFRILALLDGQLPPGLVPADSDLALLTLDSAINPDYQAIQFAPVFAKQADRTYQPNQPQRDYLQQYLETLLADTEQTLEQPLAMRLGVGRES